MPGGTVNPGRSKGVRKGIDRAGQRDGYRDGTEGEASGIVTVLRRQREGGVLHPPGAALMINDGDVSNSRMPFTSSIDVAFLRARHALSNWVSSVIVDCRGFV